MTRLDQIDYKYHILCLTIIFLPFLLFFWMLPFIGSMTIGNDYPIFSTPHQMELMFSIKKGSYPLYVPGFAGGQSSAALTLGQLFHPISWIMSHMPGYWSGMALEWNTLFRLISIGITQLLLFNFIRQLQFDMLLSFLLSFVTVYNLEMLDLFRYGASLEGWTGLLLLCSAMGLYYLNPTRFTGPMLIILSTYWLVCSGHPQTMYYGILGAFIFAVILPFWVAEVQPEKVVEIRGIVAFWGKTVLFCITGLILSTAYILPFLFDFVATNAGRVDQGYEWANSYQDTFMGTINNFFQPFKTSVHGNFGGTTLFLVAALAPSLIFFRVKIPHVIMGIWVITLLVFMHMQGDRTPVHYLVWEYFPLASNIRIAGRLAIFMPILFMLLIGWVFHINTYRINVSPVSGKKIELGPSTILGIIGLMSFLIYILISYYYVSIPDIYSPMNIRTIPTIVMTSNILFGVITLLLFCSYDMLKKMKGIYIFLMCTVVCLQVALLIYYGTWRVEKEDTLTLNQIASIKMRELVPACVSGNGMASRIVDKQVSNSFIEPFLGKFYEKYTIVSDDDTAYEMMARNRTPDTIVLEGYVKNGCSPEKIPEDIENHSYVKLKYSSYNQLLFDIYSNYSGFFCLAYPYTELWKAYLNGRTVPIYTANGGNIAIQVPAGTNKVEFKYWSPAVFWGILISCITIVIIGIGVGYLLSNRIVGVTIKFASVLISTVIFCIWHHSLYSGSNLNTQYEWESSQLPSNENIAYGKYTEIMPPIQALKYVYASGRAVDGDRTSQVGFLTDVGNNPLWYVDLSRNHTIENIILYEGLSVPRTCSKSLNIGFSNNKVNWALVPVEVQCFPFTIHLSKPVTARYILISAKGICQLSLGEVEIFSPVQN